MTCQICKKTVNGVFDMLGIWACGNCIEEAHQIASGALNDHITNILSFPQTEDTRPVCPVFRMLPNEKAYLKITGTELEAVEHKKISKYEAFE